MPFWNQIKMPKIHKHLIKFKKANKEMLSLEQILRSESKLTFVLSYCGILTTLKTGSIRYYSKYGADSYVFVGSAVAENRGTRSMLYKTKLWAFVTAFAHIRRKFPHLQRIWGSKCKTEVNWSLPCDNVIEEILQYKV